MAKTTIFSMEHLYFSNNEIKYKTAYIKGKYENKSIDVEIRDSEDNVTEILVRVIILNVFDTPMIMTWKTDNEGVSGDTEIMIPTTGDGYNYTIDWGDGTTSDNVTGSITHVYESGGVLQ